VAVFKNKIPAFKLTADFLIAYQCYEKEERQRKR